MSESIKRPTGAWDCGWDEHKLRQMRRLARLSLAEKLAWLEEAHQLVDTLTAQQTLKARRTPDADPNDDRPS